MSAVRLVSLAALALGSLYLSSASANDAVPSKIDAVVVYPTGADVARTLHVKLTAGEQSVLINDLPAGALAQSIRIEGKSAGGQVQIGSVDTRRAQVPRADADAVAGKRREIETQIEALHDQKGLLDADIQAAEAQKKLVAEMTKIPARPIAAGGTAVEPDWTKLAQTIAERSTAAQRTILETGIKIRTLDRQVAELQKTLAGLAPAPEMRTEVKVFVSAAAATDADLVVRYQVSNAGWAPFYDARLVTGAKGQAPKLQLVRRASITQRSGESWDDVALTLSTTRPAAATAAPELPMLSVDYEAERPVPVPVAAAMPAPPMARNAVRAKALGAMQATADGVAGAPEMVAAQEQSSSTETQGFQVLYSIPGKVSVAPTGEQKRVQIGAEDLEPSLIVRSVPRLDPTAYLYAKLTLPKTDGPILPGAVSLFRDGTFVGQGVVPQLAAGEDHELGFGADDLVKVKRIVVEDKTGETGVFTSTRAEQRNFAITVKNLHPNPALVQIIDRVPVSMQQDIKVDSTFRPQPTRKDVNDRRGTVAWDLTVAPDQESQIAFGYKVTAPAGKPMSYRELSQQEIQANQRTIR